MTTSGAEHVGQLYGLQQMNSLPAIVVTSGSKAPISLRRNRVVKRDVRTLVAKLMQGRERACIIAQQDRLGDPQFEPFGR